MYIRKAHNKKGTRSILVNLPIPYIERLKIEPGDYLSINEEDFKIIIERVDFPIELSKEEKEKNKDDTA
jgi:bifunctional DNA-binding transcriptional regulator/antitoxin component of YhaV-PrlF toxin-antitoxin module